jgi:hypothetical protein
VGDSAEALFSDLIKRKLISTESLIELGHMPKGETRSPWDYHEFLLASGEKRDEAIYAHIWMAEVLEGLSIGDILVSAGSMFRKDEPLEFFGPTLELLGEFLKRDQETWIISATNRLSVQFIVQTYMNPELVKRGFPEMPLDKVIGMQAAEPLKITENKINWDKIHQNLWSLPILKPFPSNTGKASYFKKHIAEKAWFAASDSQSDLALLQLGDKALVLKVPQGEGQYSWDESQYPDFFFEILK